MADLLIADFEADDVLGSGGDQWSLSWGSELIHQHLVPQLKPGSKVLDICAGWGRASIPLGIYGCEITVFDQNPDPIDFVTQYGQDMGFPVRTVISDIDRIMDVFPYEKFDAVVVLEGVVHLHKTRVKQLLANLNDLLVPSGVFYVDAPSTQDWHYEYFKETREQVDDDTFLNECSCSGVVQLDPFCFFHPGELPLLLNQQGLKVNFQRSDYLEYTTLKTLAIGQKPA